MQPPQPPHGGHPPAYGPPNGPPVPPGPPIPPGPPRPPGPPGWGPPGPPGGRPPNGNPAVVVIVIAAAFVMLLGGVGIVWWWLDSSSKPSRRVVSVPTLSGLPTPPTYSPPSYNPPSYTPTTPSTTYSPPEMNYGAIAVGSNGSFGRAWDYDSPSAARRRALAQCPGSGCKVLTTFVNGCGAVAYNSRTSKYWGGHGDTRAEAQRNAISNAGGGRWVTWVCTTR
ncbi:DUF4189 domain-containing protein [Actinomadura yumaensis]|uniref:DUF4189 domain-containing protein n=2 Tax=Actinomadura TaxID=1988 RepID=A0ABW2CGL1_9ACTN